MVWKKVGFTIILILLIQYVIAITAGTNYEVTKIPRCYGPTIIKIRGSNGVWDGGYNIVKFKKTGTDRRDDIWSYSCNNNNGEELPIIIATADNVSNVYNIRLEYYIGSYIQTGDIESGGLNKEQMQNDNNKRVLTFTGIEFTPKPKEKKSLFASFPSLSNVGGGKWIFIIVVFIIVLVVGGALYVVYRIFFKEDDEVISEATLSGNTKEITDEEVFEYIRNNVR